MHEFFMRRCLELAQKGRQHTGMNPMVGAVLVRPTGRVESGPHFAKATRGKKWKVENDSIIGEGYHEGFGKSHAERQLLEKLEHKISSDDILYVNLEPCCHTHKKTPPCAQMLIERGIKNVVYGMKDPNPEVSGKGIDYLNKKDIQVTGPILEQECKRLNRGFVSIMTKNRPWITLKSAVTSDGRIAHPDRSPLRITSPEQDRWSHELLRARHDAILVGVGTVIADNPRLTIRWVENPPALKRIVLDPHLRIPLSATVTGDECASETIILCSSDLTGDDAAEKIRVLEGRGVTVLRVPVEGSVFHSDAFFRVLTTPTKDFCGITSLLIEGGEKTWNHFKSEGLVDEEVTLIGRE